MDELCTPSSTNSDSHYSRRRRPPFSLNFMRIIFTLILILILLMTHSSGTDINIADKEELVDPQTHNCKREKGGSHSGVLKEKCKKKVEIPTIKVEEFMMRMSANHGKCRKPGSYMYHEVPSGPNPISNSMPGTK